VANTIEHVHARIKDKTGFGIINNNKKGQLKESTSNKYRFNEN